MWALSCVLYLSISHSLPSSVSFIAELKHSNRIACVCPPSVSRAMWEAAVIGTGILFGQANVGRTNCPHTNTTRALFLPYSCTMVADSVSGYLVCCALSLSLEALRLLLYSSSIAMCRLQCGSRSCSTTAASTTNSSSRHTLWQMGL